MRRFSKSKQGFRKKDNYTVPPMEKILQHVSGSEMFSLLDGFSGYNQVLVSKADQLKTTFRTPWVLIPTGECRLS